MTITFDLGLIYSLSTARIFGNYIGTWISETWTLKYKTNSGDSWATAFENQDCSDTAWFQEDVSAATQARYIQIIINGNTTTHETQAEELELFGTVYSGGEGSPSSGRSTGSYGGPNSAIGSYSASGLTAP